MRNPYRPRSRVLGCPPAGSCGRQSPSRGPHRWHRSLPDGWGTRGTAQCVALLMTDRSDVYRGEVWRGAENRYAMLMRDRPFSANVRLMDRRLERIPPVYAKFLMLRDKGLGDQAIADRLDMPVESLPLLARLAEAKLARLIDESPGPSPTNPSPGAPATTWRETADRDCQTTGGGSRS